MHTYSTDNDLRPKVYAYLALVSYFLTVIVTGLGSTLVDTIPSEPASSVLLSVPSWGVVFAAITREFNRWGWKMGIVRKMGLVEVPDLNGRWEGWVTETRSDLPSQSDAGQIEACINIKQTWRKIAIEFETDSSDSKSIGATILTKQRVRPTIIHHYKNEPKHSTSDRLDMHYGTSNMTLEKQDQGQRPDILTGFHYTGPQRETNGELRFKRVESLE